MSSVIAKSNIEGVAENSWVQPEIEGEIFGIETISVDIGGGCACFGTHSRRDGAFEKFWYVTLTGATFENIIPKPVLKVLAREFESKWRDGFKFAESEVVVEAIVCYFLQEDSSWMTFKHEQKEGCHMLLFAKILCYYQSQSKRN